MPPEEPQAVQMAVSTAGITPSVPKEEGDAVTTSENRPLGKYPLQPNPLAGCSLCHVDVEDEFVGTKHFDEFPGLELLRHVSAEVRLPAFAIGGITAENLPEVLAAGFSRLAVSGAIASADDPAAAAQEILAVLT